MTTAVCFEHRGLMSRRKKRLSPEEQEAEEARLAERAKEIQRKTTEIKWTALVDVITDVAEMSKRWRS
jgi:hypothetical protein